MNKKTFYVKIIYHICTIKFNLLCFVACPVVSQSLLVGNVGPYHEAQNWMCKKVYPANDRKTGDRKDDKRGCGEIGKRA